MKHFLLTAGHTYYPQPATEDWIGCFSTRGEVELRIIAFRIGLRWST